jgi:prophage tail gpP-like protein
MRNVIIGSDANGGLLLIGEHPATTRGGLWEGVHIERANCVIRDNMVYKKIFSIGQNTSNNTANGDPENKQVAERDGTSTRERHLVIVADVADKRHGIERRAEMEKVFTQGSEVEAQITVQGWFKDNNTSEDIWRAGEYYSVNSPSLLMYDQVLGCAGCVYEQDATGTRTTLTLVDPIHMNGRFNFREANLQYRKEQADARAKAQAKPPAPTPATTTGAIDT